MNKRLNELMVEAGYAAPEIAGRANLLAQLIIKECAMFSMVITDNHYDVDALYRHFGVEE